MSTTSPVSAPRTARQRARLELTAEIKATARRHLADHGSSGLSLRAIARELGMASSAIYRYFPSRDELLTALIVDAYDAVGAAAEQADAEQPRASIERRWMAATGAIRHWALGDPHEYALIYGSPVPGYRAPQDTIDPATRVTLVLLRIARDGVDGGTIRTGTRPAPIPRSVRDDLARIRDVAPDVPDEVLLRTLAVWAQLFGSISLELFGHTHGVIEDGDGFFELLMRQAMHFLIG